MKILSLLLTLLIPCLIFAAPPVAPVAKEKQENLDEMSAVIDLFSQKEFEKAEKGFRALLQRDLTTSTAGKVSFNLGITLRVEKKYAEAVKVFEGILASKVDDREPGEHLMEEFMNYRYRSCLQIALCYEAQGDFAKALSAVELARDKHKYEAHCGTCAAQAKKGLDARLAALGAKVKK